MIRYALALGACLTAGPALADWTAATPDVAQAAKDPRIAAVLDAVNRLDESLIDDNVAIFSGMMADDLVVNNPQNGVSLPGATRARNASGQISYTSYHRRIEYAGLRGDMVVLMGEERTVAKPPNPTAGKEVRRRFTDLWKKAGDRWVLTARQATIIGAP